MRAAMVMLAVVTGTACAGNPTPVPVLGAAADVAQLAGEWYGEYSSSETGRAGSIVFSLAAGTDTARGDVLLAAPGTRVTPGGVDAHLMRSVPLPERSQLLTVHFIRVQGGQVSGHLEPYTDPNCDCTVSTEFLGRLTADTLAGTYTIQRLTGLTQQGRWRVVRRRH